MGSTDTSACASLEELPDGITKVSIVGRLDMGGAASVEPLLTDAAGTRWAVLIDLAQVTFVASMGARTLLNTARAIVRRGGRVRFYGANEMVHRVLSTTGIDQIAAIDDLFETARAALTASPSSPSTRDPRV